MVSEYYLTFMLSKAELMSFVFSRFQICKLVIAIIRFHLIWGIYYRNKASFRICVLGSTLKQILPDLSKNELDFSKIEHRMALQIYYSYQVNISFILGYTTLNKIYVIQISSTSFFHVKTKIHIANF